MFTGSPVLTLLLACLCSLVLSEGTNPGLVGRITSKGLDYARQEALAVLRQKLAELRLPDFSGSYKVKVIGNVHYELDSLTVRNFQLPSSSISPIPDVGLRVTVTDAFAELRGDWSVKKRWFKDSGSFDLDIEGLFISVGLKLGSDASGRPTAAPLDCRTQISKVRVHFSGRLSWLYNLFHRNVESALRGAMEDKVCGEVSASVSSKLLPFLQSMPVTANIDKMVGIDYTLVSPPVATANFVDLKLKGEFFSLAHRAPAPFPSPVLALPTNHDRMLYFGISSYFFNTAGTVYDRAGSLNFVITDDMIPNEIKIRLNTTSFGPFVPQIEKLYPHLPMKLHVSPASAPALTITPELVALSPVVDVQAFAVLSNSSLAPLFVVSMSTSVSAKVSVNATKIFGSLTLGRLRLSLKHSEVGPFSVQLIQTLLNFSAKNILLRQVNARLAEGFPLPLPDDVQLANPMLQLHQDFLLFGSDVRYGQ